MSAVDNMNAANDLSHAVGEPTLPPSTSYGRRFVEQFVAHRIALVSLIFVVVMGLTALFAPVIASVLGISAFDQNIANRYLKMGALVDVSSQDKEAAMEKMIAADPDWRDRLASQLKDHHLAEPTSSADDALFDVLGKLSDEETLKTVKTIATPDVAKLLKLQKGFAVKHWLGTDDLGRDVLARLIFGARISLLVALLTGLSAALIGLCVGCLAGFYGGWVDAALMRLTDALLALPVLPLLIVLAAVDLKKVPVLGSVLTMVGSESESIAKMIFILGVFAWMPMARFVRGSVLSIRESEFVLAAHIIGARDLRIMSLHLVPNILAPLLVSVTLATGENMLFESALSFLGLGIQPPVPSWGNMLENALELIHSAPMLAVMPGLMIFLVVMAVNFIGDGLRDCFDPKSAQQ